MSRSCTYCTENTKQNRRCKNLTCKWSPVCHVHRKITIKDSTIPLAGLGVFASTNIKANTKIADYTIGTKSLTCKELNMKYPDNKTAKYVWKKNKNQFYDATPTSRIKSVAGLFNTCRSQNKIKKYCKRNNAKILSTGSIRTLHNIKKGEEIFVPYGKDYIL